MRSTEGLWKIISKFRCPDRFVKIVRQFRDGMMARVLDDGNAYDPFKESSGVKQGYILAPVLFSLIFSVMLTDAFRETSLGIPIKYRCDRKLFTLRHLQAITKVKQTVIRLFVNMVNVYILHSYLGYQRLRYIRDLLFANDCTLHAINGKKRKRRWMHSHL